MIRRIGSNQNEVIVVMSKSDWTDLQLASGVPYDKRECTMEVSSDKIEEAVHTLSEMKTFRKELGKLQKTWDNLASKIDEVLPQ